MNGKVSSVLATTASILLLKLAVQNSKGHLAQLFELLFVIWGSYLVISLLYLTQGRKMSLFSFKMENPWFVAQLMAAYIVIDTICLLYMSLATYCIIKLCLTGTFKVIQDPENSGWNYTSQGVPHRCRRLTACFILIPLVIMHDLLYQVLYRDKVQEFFGKKTDEIEIMDEDFSLGAWAGWYCLFIVLHLFNTVVVHQIWMGRRIKQMSTEQKVYDLPRLRWFAATLICLVSPICAILMSKSCETPRTVMAGNGWLVWVAAIVYSLLCVTYYSGSLDTSCRKDALIPTKRHTQWLLLVLPPATIAYELFLSREALGLTTAPC